MDSRCLSNNTVGLKRPILNKSRLLNITAALLLLLLPSSCALLVVGAAGGALILHDVRSTKVMLQDSRTEIRATDILYSDKDLLKKIHVNVTSYNQIVLLTGEVLSELEQQKVLEIVSNMEGVKRVHNELRISNLTTLSKRSGDTWLTTKVKTKMFATEGFDPNRIKVVTESDSVYLMGIVTHKVGKLASKIASEVEGVQRVVTFFEYVYDDKNVTL